MPVWLDNILSPLNAAGEGIQKLIETRDLVKFGDALGKVYAQVLSAQRGALTAQANEQAMAEEIRHLKEKVRELEALNTELEKYELVSLAPNVVAMALKETERSKAPAHYLCADCAANGKRFHLQQVMHGQYHERYRCNGCELVLDIDKGTPPPRSASPRYNPF